MVKTDSSFRNITIFYLLTMVMGCWFVAGNWIFFWTRFMTFGQLGIIDSIAFSFALLMEIPTGAIADLLGKKRTVQAAMLCLAIGILIISMANNLYTIFWAFLIAHTGWALYSGAAEALAYDTLVEHKQEDKFEKIITKSSTIALITETISILIGAGLFMLNFRLPHIIWGLTFTIGFILTFFLTEPKVDTDKFTFKGYFNQLTLGVKELGQPALKKYLILIFLVLGIYYMYDYGLIKPAIATSFGILNLGQSLNNSLLLLITAGVVRLLPLIRRKISDRTGLIILASIIATCFFIFSVPIGYAAFIIMIILGITGSLGTPWVSIIVNKEIPSKYRATTLSTIALISKIPYAIVAVIAGFAVEGGNLRIFTLSVGIIIVLGIIINHLISKSTSHHKTLPN
jgi:MFS family permease